jgi:replicative DNA helicase
VKLPHSIEAEESVIGGLLVHARKFVEVAPLVRAEDFYHPALRAVYEAMAELDVQSKPLDEVTVVEQMRSLGTFEKLHAFDGHKYLFDLMTKVVTAENIGYHAGIVRSKADRRRVAEAARDVQALALDEETPDDDFARQADQRLLDLQRFAHDDSKPKQIEKVLYRAMKGIERRYDNRANPGALGITTGYEAFDRLTTGMQPGELWVLAARPGMGKSAFAGNIVQRVAAHGSPYACLVFSLEMSDESLVERMIAVEGPSELHKIRTGDLDRADWRRVSTAAGELATRPIYIDDAGSLTIVDIRSRARRWRLNEGAPPKDQPGRPCVIVVDYLQLVTSQSRSGDTRDRQLEIAAVSRGLKLLAKELGGAVLALAQLSRKCEERSDKRPMLSDLRESGAIEQDADIVAFLYRDEVYSGKECKEEDRGMCEVIVGKQRNGPTGTVRLGWDGKTGRFLNL